MSSIVIELQQDALDKSIPVEDLLRKALVVSKKLGISEIEEWINSELNGYDQTSKIPKYREIRGIIKAFNPYQGWIPVQFETEEDSVLASTQLNRNSIGEISNLSEGKNLQAEISPELKKALWDSNGVKFDIKLFISPTSMVGILERVRNDILEWALELEKNGIVGNDFSFTKSEQQKATVNSYSIVNNIGIMNHSAVQQLSHGAHQELKVADIEELISLAKNLIAEGKLSKDQAAELQSEIITIEAQKKSPKPKKQIIIESMKTIRNIAEGATGSIVATGLLNTISQFF